MVSRRRVFGTVGVGALVAACSGTAEPTTSATVPTTGGGSATVAPQTGTSGLAELFPGAASCALTPAETEGPYYFDVNSIRGDIREDRAGVPLRLALRIGDASCAPVANAVVDVWHCDAAGVYSGFEAASRGGGGGHSDDAKYLRGAQATNADGIVEFLTVYPGWYRGRTVHIHFKVHLDNRTLLTSQLYFDEAVTAQVYTKEPYSGRAGRDRFNKDDPLFSSALMLTLRADGAGYLGLMSVNAKA